MHPRIREIAFEIHLLRRTTEEVSSLLPAGDDELDEWLSLAVAEKDPLLFLHLAVAAMHIERGVASHHLVRGLHLLTDPYHAGVTAWRARGDDVPERILEALRDTPNSPTNRTALLQITGEWCKERRDGQFPPELITEARLLARNAKGMENRAAGHLISLAQTVGDPRISDLVLKSIGQPPQQHPKLIKASCAIGDSFLGMCRKPVAEFLREEPIKERRGFTVRRSVEHFGRNEPCHCGSGRKYKRCCFEKDAERLQLSTDVSGATYAEILAAPEQYLDKARLLKTQPIDLNRIDPLKLDADLLPTYFGRLYAYNMLEKLTSELETIGWCPDFDASWKFALYTSARDGRIDLTERLLALRRAVEDPPFPEPPPDWVSLALVRDDPAAFVKVLGEIAAFAAGEKDFAFANDVALALLFSPIPALGILLGRGVIPFSDKPTAVHLLEEMLIAREKLNLSPDEPASDLLDKRFASEAIASGAKETEKLREARRKLEAKAEEVRHMKSSLEQLRAEISRREKPQPAKPAESTESTHAAPVDAEVLRDLRQKVSTLKSALKERHAERATLRRDLSHTLTELETLREKQPKTPTNPQPATDSEDLLLLPGEIEGNQPVRILELPKKFHHTLSHVPRQVARGAMVLLGRLAAGEPDAFTGVVRLKQRPDTLRARIGIDHRLLFRLDAEAVHVIDLIPRQDLERRIKTL
jgi:hypothetical protein